MFGWVFLGGPHIEPRSDRRQKLGVYIDCEVPEDVTQETQLVEIDILVVEGQGVSGTKGVAVLLDLFLQPGRSGQDVLVDLPLVIPYQIEKAFLVDLG